MPESAIVNAQGPCGKTREVLQCFSKPASVTTCIEEDKGHLSAVQKKVRVILLAQRKTSYYWCPWKTEQHVVA